jgi:hypothetical protein
MMDRTRSSLVALPVVLLLAGGAAGWFMRDTPAPGVSLGTVVGAPLPTGAALDGVAPTRHVPNAPNTMVFDRRALIGLPDDTRTVVPKGAVLPVTRDSAGALTPVDPTSLQPVTVTEPAPAPVQDPTVLEAATPPPAPPSTAEFGDPTTTLPLAVPPAFVDPCRTTPDQPCVGEPARVVEATDGPTTALDPLLISVPMAATGDLATMCDTIEAGTLPDPFLGPQVRPTVAVVVNQPSSIALTGTWADGTPLEKLTMVTSSAFDDQWQTQWDTGAVQGSLLQCLTLPLDEVRAHATAGRAVLDAKLLAISKGGRAELGGRLTLSIPLDGDDPPFVDALGIGSLGEQRRDDGTLVPTVHVHYAFTDDQLIPSTGTLNVVTAKLYAQHAFVENADCAGWANNQQGLDRTLEGRFDVGNEQRTVSGRSRPVTVVDGDLALDPSVAGGWEGFVCMRLFLADDEGHTVTVALRGASVRSPLTATYSVGVVIDDPGLPHQWTMEATWATTTGALWCGPVVLPPGLSGATCATSARAVPDGVRLFLRATGGTVTERPAFVVTVPINTAYCTPDDPYAAISNGCDTGFTQRLLVPVDATGTQYVPVQLQVVRSAAAGAADLAPAHVWRIDVPQSFTF